MTHGELIEALIREAGVLGCSMTGSDAFTGACGLTFAVEWAEAHVRNFPADRRWALLNDHAVAAWLRRARAAIILYKIV